MRPLLLVLNLTVILLGIAAWRFFHWAGWEVSIAFLALFVVGEFAYRKRYGDWF